MKFIELHLHLDGAITVEIARKLAAFQKIELNVKNDDELKSKLVAGADCESLDDFLKCFELSISLMQTKKGIAEAVRLVQENLKSQNVIYAELRFSPALFTKGGLTQKQVIKAALKGLKQSDLKCNLILCCMRGLSREENLETVMLAKKFLKKNNGVVAIDLAGPESDYMTSIFPEEFELAKKKKIPVTIHAGEAGNSDNVISAINFGASRIGHGIRIMNDEYAKNLVKEKNITLEFCPTSNKITHVLSDFKNYPIQEFLNEGIKVTVNTDDMAICDTTIEKEFDFISKEYGITAEQQKILTLNAIDAAFTDEKTKAKLRLEVQEKK